MHGRAFLGPYKMDTPHRYAFGSADRFDDVYDMSRSVIDGRHSSYTQVIVPRPFIGPVDEIPVGIDTEHACFTVDIVKVPIDNICDTKIKAPDELGVFLVHVVVVHHGDPHQRIWRDELGTV